MTCDRCGKTTQGGYTTSYFNTDKICFDCDLAESEHPDYERARRIEGQEMAKGNMNFPGIGLPPELRKHAEKKSSDSQINP